MNFDEFKAAVVEGISERFGEKYHVECVSVGESDLLCVYLAEWDLSVSDTFDGYFQMYQSGMSLEDVLDRIEADFRPEFG